MLEVRNIAKAFGEFSLNDISFTVNAGEYFVLLGLSGAGKSLLLELIAGLETPDSGQIFLKGEDITHKKIQKRKVGIVFQDLALFPHLSVLENIRFPLKSQGQQHEVSAEYLADTLAGLGITHLLHRRPDTLSGGEKQRVALARVMMCKPDILLLDEPLSSLDVQLRDDIRSNLRKINQAGMTIIHVTHDFDEAISLAGRIAVMQEGRLIQEGTAAEVFGSPGSAFVARFAGIKNYFTVKELSLSAEGKNLVHLENDVILEMNSAAGKPVAALMLDSNSIKLERLAHDGLRSNFFSGILLEIVPALHGAELVVDIGIPVNVHCSAEKLSNNNFKIGEALVLSFPATAIECVFL